MTNKTPLDICREKLDYLRVEEAKAASPATKFEIKYQIEELKEKIADFEAEERACLRKFSANPPEAKDEQATSDQPQDLFDIRPIQEQGQNIYFHDIRKDEFFVKVHFNLWTKHPLVIINVDLTYYPAYAMPGPKNISINQPGEVYEEIDSSFRMKNRRSIDAKSVISIFVSRRWFFGRGDDYGMVTLTFEVASPAWKGIKELTFKGNLAPGGRLDIISVALV